MIGRVHLHTLTGSYDEDFSVSKCIDKFNHNFSWKLLTSYTSAKLADQAYMQTNKLFSSMDRYYTAW